MQAVTEDLGSTSGHLPPRFRPVPGLLRPWTPGAVGFSLDQWRFRIPGFWSVECDVFSWDEDLLSWPFDAILCHLSGVPVVFAISTGQLP